MKKEKPHIYVRRIALTILIIVAAMFQNTDHMFPTILGIRVLFLIPVVVCISMFEKDIAPFFGAFAGMLWDITSAAPDGYNTIFMMLTASVCGVMINYIMRNNIITALLLTSCSLVSYSLFYWLFFIVPKGIEGGAMMLFTFYLPCCLYTIIFMPVIYIMIRAFIKKLRDSMPVQRRIPRL
ncbi:MAG: hypothetical protein RR911_05025 [Oscillospiraceae bacterium]